MPVAYSGQNETAVYTSETECLRFLPPDAIADVGDTTPARGKVLYTDFLAYMANWSRDFDAQFGAKGFATPYPDLPAAEADVTKVKPPRRCVDLVTARVVADVRTHLNFGNRKAQDVTFWRREADNRERDLFNRPQSIGYGMVSTVEKFQTKTLATDQYGRMMSPLYRLANRNILDDSLVFCNASGAEVFRPEGLPFLLDVDYVVESAAQGIIALINESAIIAQISTTGGVKYRFSWLDLTFGQAHPEPMRGVSRL